MSKLLEAALVYRDAGLSVVPVLSNKKSLIEWKHLQQRQMTVREIHRAFRNEAVTGIAIVCGAVSGGFETIDLDDKNDLDRTLSQSYMERLQESNADLFKKMVIATTKNKGYHLYYACKDPEPTMDLAKRPATDAEKAESPGVQCMTLGERRGEGGYVIVPPSEGYSFIQGDLSQTPFLKPTQRNQLSEILRGFNKWNESVYTSPPVQSTSFWSEEDPFEDYNRQINPVGLLVNRGWKIVGTAEDQVFLRRPGKTDHWSSGDYHSVLNRFMVFTSSTPFVRLKGYSPAAVFAVLECQGNFIEAAKRLLDLGYGVPYKMRSKAY